MPKLRRGGASQLDVYLNGKRVGTLSRHSSGAIEFSYHRHWLDWEHTLPISRSLPLREDRYVGAPVVAVFDNLLPDNDAIRRKVAEQTAALGVDTFSLLASIGRDCVGALQFLPPGTAPADIREIRSEPLSTKKIASLMRSLGSHPLGLGESTDFRISIAGAQEKTALLYYNKRWHKPHGTTPTTHILKPVIGILPNGLDLSRSVENEFLCSQLLNALGLRTARTAILDFEDQRVLAVERFDRLWTKNGTLLRLPQEDMCQALSVAPTLKYESEGGPGMARILNLLKESDTPRDDQMRFLSAQILFWMMGATDGHAKNFSLFMARGGRFHMTPLYDVLSSMPNVAKKQIGPNKAKLAMSVGDRRYYRLHVIRPRHFAQTAKTAGIHESVVDDIFNRIAKRVSPAIAEVEEALPTKFPADIADPIFNALKKHEMVR